MLAVCIATNRYTRKVVAIATLDGQHGRILDKPLQYSVSLSQIQTDECSNGQLPASGGFIVHFTSGGFVVHFTKCLNTFARSSLSTNCNLKSKLLNIEQLPNGK